MEALRKIVKTARADFENVGFLKFLVAAGIYIFAAGGLLWLIGGFLPFTSPGVYFVRTLLATSGRVLLAVGLLFAIVKGEELLLVIISAAISTGALVMMIVELAANRYYATFESWFFFVLFGGIATLIILFGDKFKQMRADAKAASQARAAQRAAQAAQAPPKLIACPNCGGPVPFEAKVCPACGAPNPAQMAYTPPPAPAAAASAPPPAPEPAPAPKAAPAPKKAAKPKKAAAPKKTAEPETKACVNCGEQIPAGAAFCGKCGAKQ